MKRIVFIGCANLSWHCLDELLKNKANVVAIFTLDDLSAKSASDLKSPEDLAKKYSIPLHKIKRSESNTQENISKISSYNPEVLFCIGWPDIIKKEILSLAKYSFGMHPSKLPKDRGQAPVPWSIIRGYAKNALSMFVLDEIEDAGPVIAQVDYHINEDDTSTTVYGKLIEAGRRIIREVLPKIEQESIKGISQNEAEATYTRKRSPIDGYIDWNSPAKEIYNLIRALTGPYYPGAFTFFNNNKITIWSAKIFIPNDKYFGIPGQIMHTSKDGIIVRAKDGCLKVDKISVDNDPFEKAVNPATIDFLKKNVRLGINPIEEIVKLRKKLEELENARH